MFPGLYVSFYRSAADAASTGAKGEEETSGRSVDVHDYADRFPVDRNVDPNPRVSFAETGL